MRSGGNTFIWRGDRMLRPQFRPLSRCGAQYAQAATQSQVRPVIQSGATIMDRLFGSSADRAAEAVARHNGSRTKRGPGERDSTRDVSYTVRQALYINSSATIEMRSDKAEQWSG